jgi:hypothetical protein
MSVDLSGYFCFTVVTPSVFGNYHIGYTSGTADCPFWAEAMANLPSSAIFRRLSIRARPSWYRKE